MTPAYFPSLAQKAASLPSTLYKVEFGGRFTRNRNAPGTQADKPAQGKSTENKPKRPLLVRQYHRGEQAVRRFMNKRMAKALGDDVQTIQQALKQFKPEQPEFVSLLYTIAEMVGSMYPIEVEINSETNLADITGTDEACIFVINHDHQSQDPMLLANLGVRLYHDYIAQGREETCPRPKVILNEDILTTQTPELREIFEGFGAVGVDTGLSDLGSGSMANAARMRQLLKSFVDDENHVFIFPEGIQALDKRRPLLDRFQLGVGEMVYLASLKKPRVKVIPVGFALKESKAQLPRKLAGRLPGIKRLGVARPRPALGSIYLGKPISFIRDGKQLYTDAANVTLEDTDDDYRQFFWQVSDPRISRRDFLKRLVNPFAEPTPAPPVTIPADYQKTLLDIPGRLLTLAGSPAKGKTLVSVVSGVMAENLRICRQKALDNLPGELAPPETVNHY